MTTANLAIKVTADTAAAARGLDTVGSSGGKLESGLKKASVAAAAVGVGLLAVGKVAFDAASKAQQAGGAVDAVFGSSAKSVHKFAKSSADDVGLSSGAYEEMAATFGAQLKNMGTAQKKLAPQTDELIGLGADLAAQYGGSTADAVGALGSLMRGETDPIERYGVSIKAADVAAKKAAMGLDGLTGKADKQATAQATLALLTEQTTSAHGAFAREANTAAGAQARATAKMDNAAAAIGTALLPIVAKLATVLATVAGVIQRNQGVFQILAVVIGTVTVAVWALNAALAVNPITLVVAAVAALVAGLILAYKKCTTFRNIVDKVGDVAQAVFKAIVIAVKAVVGWVKTAWRWVGPKLSAAFKVVKVIAKVVFKVISTYVKVYIAVIRTVVKILRVVIPAAFRVVKVIAGAVFKVLKVYVMTYIKVVRTLINVVRTVLAAAFRVVKAVAQTVFGAIRTALQFVIDKARAVVTFLRDVFAGAFRFVRDVVRSVVAVIRTILQSIIDKARTVVAFLRTVLTGAFRFVRDVVKGVVDTIKTQIDKVIAVVTTLYTWVKTTLAGAWSAMESVATTAINAITTPIEWLIDKIEDLIGWIGRIKFPSPPSWVTGGLGAIGGLFSLPVPPPAARATYTAPGVATRSGTSTRSAGGGVTINVNGALDPDAVARQIERLLRARSRRTVGVAR